MINYVMFKNKGLKNIQIDYFINYKIFTKFIHFLSYHLFNKLIVNKWADPITNPNTAGKMIYS